MFFFYLFQRKRLGYVILHMGVVRSTGSVVLLVHSLPLITLFLTQMMPLAFGSSLYLPEKECILNLKSLILKQFFIVVNN